MRKLLKMVLFTTLCTGCRAETPPPPTTLDDLARQQVGALVDQRLVIGAAMGIITPQGRHTFYYGRTSKDADTPPTADTIFEIGSITKVFTGTLLAAMHLDKSLSLYDTVQSCLPPSVTMPAFDGQPITLQHLAMQNSGLPRLPDNFGRDADPYSKYDTARLYSFLSSHKLRRAPGVEYEYSNLAVGLLGHALALQGGTDFEALIQERICTPLGMADTVVHTRHEQFPRVAQGYGLTLDLAGIRLHSKEAPWTWDALAGAGALHSTLPDMMKFLAAAMGNDTPLKEAFALSHQPMFEFAPHNHTGLNWHISTNPDTGHKLIWHNGQTGGYHSFLGFHPETGIGVVLLTNTATEEADAAAIGIIEGIPKLPS